MFEMPLADWKTVAETASNFAQALGIVGAIFFYVSWRVARRDRATDILFQLETRFADPQIQKGRALVEDDDCYRSVREALVSFSLPPDEFGASAPRHEEWTDYSTTARIDALDAMLRFYVVLLGVRQAGQVSERALATCYRFWLGHYFSPARRELRLYIRRYFPTLHEWLAKDAKRVWWGRCWQRSFFRPRLFGWQSDLTADRLKRALSGRVLVITGAGVSHESGIPVFRGPAGYWQGYDPRRLATRISFNENPDRVWQFYTERRLALRNATPNGAHSAICRLGEMSRDFLLITQNVDDLHERAGSPADRLVHIHGEIRFDTCTDAHCQGGPVANPGRPAEPCPTCGERMRPGVVWFDEDLDPEQERRINEFLERGACDLVLIVGTSATFDYIVNWGLRAAGDRGLLIEVNPEPTHFSPTADLVIREPASEALPKLLETASASGLRSLLRRKSLCRARGTAASASRL
jgi:NAD-dependent deacetylase